MNRKIKRVVFGMTGATLGEAYDYDMHDLGAMRRLQSELRHRGYNLECDPAAQELQYDIDRAEQQWYSCNPFMNITMNRTPPPQWYGVDNCAPPQAPPPHRSNKLLLTIRRTK